jgi:glycosyltransferase involved in cell wall biosynthesis
MPSATVVVSTCRRPDTLRALLGTLAQQADPGLPWDVLVVDNGDGALVGAAADLGVAVVHEPRPGASAARNRGLAEATGDVIVFVDDDVRAAPGWLRALLAPLVAGRCDAAAGRVRLDPAVARPPWLTAELAAYLAEHDYGPEARDLGPGEYAITANAAFRADRLRALGGFDERLGPRAGQHVTNEDVLLCRRWQDDGGRIRWVPEAVVVHELPARRLSLRFLVGRTYSQGRSDWLLDRDRHRDGRLRGAGRATAELASVLRERTGEGLWRSPVAVRAACDVARTAGFVREAVGSMVAR